MAGNFGSALVVNNISGMGSRPTYQCTRVSYGTVGVQRTVNGVWIERGVRNEHLAYPFLGRLHRLGRGDHVLCNVQGDWSVLNDRTDNRRTTMGYHRSIFTGVKSRGRVVAWGTRNVYLAGALLFPQWAMRYECNLAIASMAL